MQFDRQITITVGNSRRSVNWQPSVMLVSEFYKKLEAPYRSSETLAEYMRLKKAQQDDLKDCMGGFVGGSLSGTRRKANAVTGRDIVTLDMDNIPPGGTEDILRRVDALGCGYCVYSTRKHQRPAPRLRVMFPTDRTMTPDEYEPVARKIASYVGIEFADPSTFEACRLMYWATCCADGEYVYRVGDKPFVSVDGILAQYKDWHDVTEWAAIPGTETFVRMAVKQGDPESKPGVVGAFCRRYDVLRAMDELIPGIYDACDTDPGRYTFVGGTSAGGAVLYDGGKFLYSHHATDPCSRKLVNSFDMVRLHKFGHLDDTAAAGLPHNRMPSYNAMCEFALGLNEVAAEVNAARVTSAAEDFAGLVQSVQAENDTEWLSRLDVHPQTGIPKATIQNIWIILENDPNLKGKFALNRFANRGEILGAVPWDTRPERRLWDDNDNNGLYWYIENVYKITGNGKVDAALSLHSNTHAFNDVQDYLNGLIGKWDGVPRLDTLFIDYLGAEDCPYTRAVTRKSFTAAVARAMKPGVKYDQMLILVGKQGLGKSTLLAKMSKGWFNDSIRTFEGKEASELLQGVWLVEIQELEAFRKTGDVARIKQFVSLCTDRYRAAYGRHVKSYDRPCVFFGTTNESEFLQDNTGNRRFWSVDVCRQPPTKSVFKHLDAEIDQLWAEAVMRWQLGEQLFLTGELEEVAKEKQEAHRETSPREGLILEFLDRKVPEDWVKWPLDQRKTFWAGGMVDQDSIPLVERDRVCPAEVWVEALGGDMLRMTKWDAREINAVIQASGVWEKTKSSCSFGIYGKQRGYVRNA